MPTADGTCSSAGARRLVASGLRRRFSSAAGEGSAPPFAAYSPRVKAYLLGVTALGLTLMLACAATGWSEVRGHLLLIAVMGLLAGVAEFFPIKLRYSGSVSISVIAYTFSYLVLPPCAAVAVPLPAGLVHAIRCLAEGLRCWPRVSFNAAQLAITVFVAAIVYDRLAAHGAADFSSPRWYFALLVAGFAYFFVNTSLVAVASALVRNLPVSCVWRANYVHLGPYYLGLLAAAAIAAVLWRETPLLVPLAAGLAVLLHRALNVPSLLEVARTDPKTGLYNVQHFYAALENELSRAARFGRPLSVILADLDYLREINNAYGHLAGDTILKGAAGIILASTRAYDVAARFGGEEFALLLLDTEAHEAVEVAQRIRRHMESTAFEVAGSAAPVKATLSLGVACFPGDGREPEALIHRADLAMYCAKRLGRNRVCAASDAELAKVTAELRAG